MLDYIKYICYKIIGNFITHRNFYETYNVLTRRSTDEYFKNEKRRIRINV